MFTRYEMGAFASLGVLEGDDNTTNILNSLKKGRTGILRHPRWSFSLLSRVAQFDGLGGSLV